jgi:hypothetical protein
MKITKKRAIRFGLLSGKGVALGLLAITVSACVAETSPPPRQGYYSRDDGSYSTYSGDYESFAADRDADERNGLGHSDDRNFHDRDNYDQYDR